MYEKPDSSRFHNYSSSGGTELSSWRHGLQLRIPTNAGKNFELRNFFPKRTPRDTFKVRKYKRPQDPQKIVVDHFSETLSDDSGFHSNTNTPFNTNLNAEREVNVFSFQGKGFDRGKGIKDNLPSEIGFASKLLHANRLDLSVERLLKTSNTFSHWDEEVVRTMTRKVVMNSLKANLVSKIARLRSMSGDYRIPLENIDIVRNRILDGSLEYLERTTDGIDKYVRDLFRTQEQLAASGNTNFIVKSRNPVLNEKFAVAYAQNVMRELDPDVYNAPFSYIHEIYRSLSVDLHKRLPFTTASSTLSSIPVTISESIKVDGSGAFTKKMLLEDGDFFTVDNGRGSKVALPVDTEEKHAFRLTDRDKERVLSLLGVRDLTKLTATVNYSEGVEYTNDLNLDGNKPRESFYFLKLNTDSIKTPTKLNNHVDLTEVSYDLVTTDAEIDDWVKYKTNIAFYAIEHDDLFLDYMTSSNSISAEFKDFTLRAYGPTDNEDVPIIVRNIPWCVVILPTDTIELNPLKVRSHVSEFDSTGVMSRSLFMTPHFDNRYSEAPITHFVNVSASDEIAENVFFQKNTSGAAVAMDSGASIISKTLVSGVEGIRGKTSIREIAEIVRELNTNYVIDGGLSWFDVISRLTVNEFCKLSILENSHDFMKALENGLIDEVKLFHYFSKDNKISSTGSRLVLRKEAAEELEDIFFPVKLHSITGANALRQVAPTTTAGPSTETVNPESTKNEFSREKINNRAEDVSTNVIPAPEVRTDGIGGVP